MRKIIVLCAALASCEIMQPESEWRWNFTEAELKNDEMTDTRLRAAVINDVRTWRMCRHNLNKGQSSCRAIAVTDKIAKCVADGTELAIVSFPSDPLDQTHRVQETAYYCETERVYYYHYAGGPRKLDVWLGPYKLERRRVLDD